jgi:hypothetical protein
MAEGLFCYSDDSAVLDRECKVAGMPFPIVLRQASWQVLQSRVDSIESVPVQRRWGADVRFLPSNLPGNQSRAVHANALVFVDYQPDAAVRLRPLTDFEALLALQQGGFWVEHERESIARFLDWIGQLDCYKLTYSRIEEAAVALGDLLD